MPKKQKAPFSHGDVPGMEIESFSPELLRAMNGQRIRAEERAGMEQGRRVYVRERRGWAREAALVSIAREGVL